MIMAADLLQELFYYTQVQTSDEGKARVLRQVNSEYRSVAAMESWAELRKVTTLDWSGDAVQLPANLQGIDLVYDPTNYLEFHYRSRGDASMPENMVRYFTYPVGSVLTSVEDGATSKDSTILNSPDLNTAGVTAVGEYCFIGESQQLYLITAQDEDDFTISPGYRGSGIGETNLKVIVRPASTLMLQLEGPRTYDLPTTQIEVSYWTMPDEIRDPTDIILLPTKEVLLSRTMAVLPETKSLRPVSQAEVDRRFAEALRLNPTRPRARTPQKISGVPMKPGASHNYMRRSGRSGAISPNAEAWLCRQRSS